MSSAALGNPLPIVSCYPGESTTTSSKSKTVSTDIMLNAFPGIILPVLPELSFYLCGKGEQGLGCGEMRTLYICENLKCGKPVTIPYHCRRRACPICYESWIRSETAKIEARLRSPEALKRHRGKRLVEMVLSPDQSDYGKPQTKKELLNLYRRGYRYIKKKGALGGVVVYHHFRSTTLAKRESWKAHKKTWAWIREQPRPADYYYVSPHLHLTVFVDYLQPPEKGEKWIYKTIMNKDGAGKRHVVDFLKIREEELTNEIRYLLTHSVVLAGAEETFHSIRWFGSCSYNKFKTTPLEEKIDRWEEDRKCEECGAGIIPTWTWVRLHMCDIRNGLKDPPKHIDEIEDFLADADRHKKTTHRNAHSEDPQHSCSSAMRGKCELCGATVNLVFIKTNTGKDLAVCRICKNDEERNA